MGVASLKVKKVTLFTLAAICFIRFASLSHSIVISTEDFQQLILNGEFGAVAENGYAEKYRKLTLLRNEATAMGRTPMNSFRSDLEYKYSQDFLQAVLLEFDYIFDNSDMWVDIVSNFNNISKAYGRLGGLDDFGVHFNNREIQALRDVMIPFHGLQEFRQHEGVEDEESEGEQEEEEENDENMQ